MTFPSSKRVVFTNSPLKEVICQLRFPTILEIRTEEPAVFQKKIRSQYPLYSRENGDAPFPKELANLLAQLSIPSPTENVTHKFLTADSERFISLSPEFVAVTDDKYYRWEQFWGEIELAQTALEEVYHPAFYSRIGLRYKDVIDKEEIGLAHQPWGALLDAPLIGLLGAEQVGSYVQDIKTQALIKLDEVSGGFATLRHGLARSSQNEREVYFIDVDLFTEKRSSTNDVYGILEAFNRIAGNLFRWAITPTLHTALEPTELK